MRHGAKEAQPGEGGKDGSKVEEAASGHNRQRRLFLGSLDNFEEIVCPRKQR